LELLERRYSRVGTIRLSMNLESFFAKGRGSFDLLIHSRG
jgi:hypothetical protein